MLSWDYIGIKEKKMETTGIMGGKPCYNGLFWDTGKENGNYRSYRGYAVL